MTAFLEVYQNFLDEISTNEFSDKNLYLSSANMTDEDIPAILKAIELNKNIQSLYLEGNLIGDTGAALLAQFSIDHPKKIKILDVSNNRIKKEGGKALSKSTYEEISLNGNVIEDEGISCFLDHTTLLKLNARNCYITDIGGAKILTHPVLQSLDLSFNADISAASLKNIKDNLRLKILRFDKIKIGALGGEYLSSNDSLCYLSLWDCALGDEGATNISKGLKKLEELTLSSNDIGDAGATALSKHTRLKNLVLTSNHIGHDGAIALFQSDSLKEIYLAFNKVTGNWEDVSIANQKEITLDLENNPIYTVLMERLKNTSVVLSTDDKVEKKNPYNPSNIT